MQNQNLKLISLCQLLQELLIKNIKYTFCSKMSFWFQIKFITEDYNQNTNQY